MKKMRFIPIVLILFLGLAVSTVPPVYAQTITEKDLSDVKVDDMTDAQIRAIIQQVTASGQSLDNIEQIVSDRGMPPEEISKFKQRVANLAPNATSIEETDQAKTVSGDDQLNFEDARQIRAEEKPEGLPIFGAAYFNNPKSTFAPDVNRPTPANYIVGPGDQLAINVFGNSVVNWDLTVRPEGYILLPGMGKIYVGGKTIENATQMIRARLRANNYAIGNGTEVTVSLTNIRSIKVAINGEVKNPGTYTLSSLSTVFNALYLSGGPNGNGSFRAIEVIRDNRLLARVDVYDFILRGDKSGDILLQDGDIIRVPTYQVRVSIEGEVKRPAFYEMMPGESLKDLILFAGGFKNGAYTAQIKAVQFTDKQKRVRDIPKNEFDSFVPLKGDKYMVEAVLDRFENRVVINGAVFRPGEYELEPGITLAELIEKAGGLKEDAYPERGYITRLKSDNTTEIIPFDVAAVANGTATPIPLDREDVVTISSIFDLRESYHVAIQGRVREPGKYPYSEGMTVEDLVLSAGGFALGANTKRVAIIRRVKDSDRSAKDAKLANVIEIEVDPKLSLSGLKHVLEPYDVVSVYNLPGWETTRFVQVEGEVMFPGMYPILRKDERISDVIKRAGGFTPYAYLEGASLNRGRSFETVGEVKKEKLKNEQMARGQELATGEKISAATVTQDVTIQSDLVGIDLARIMKKPGKSYDLLLKEGDLITVPGLKQTVKVSGAVLSPVSIVYHTGGFMDYIHQSGGFTANALKRKAYVMYANGSIAGTKNFLFFRTYPTIRPGAEIFVPEKEKKEPVSLQGWVGIGTSLASLAAIIFAITQTASK